MREEQFIDKEQWRELMKNSRSLYAQEMHCVADELAELSDGSLGVLCLALCDKEATSHFFGDCDSEAFRKLCRLARATALSELVARANKKVEKL